MSSPLPRRAALTATAAGGVVLPALTAGSARAALPRPARYQTTRVPPRALKHVLSRFSYGVTPELVAEATSAGGSIGWIEQQLDPASIPDPVGDDIVT